MKTRTDAVVFTTLKDKDIITTDSSGHIMLDVTKLFDTDGSEFLKCRNVAKIRKLLIGTVVRVMDFVPMSIVWQNNP